MKSTSIEFGSDSVVKYSTSKVGDRRLASELRVYEALEGSPHIPRLINATRPHGTEHASLEIERIYGQTIGENLAIGPNWKGEAHSWGKSGNALRQYAEAETDFLDRNVLYLDLAMDHVFIPSYLQRAIFIDLECSLIDREEGSWRFSSSRETYETMSPEEFLGLGNLTERVATYRTAVMAHLALSGRLPFLRLLPKTGAELARVLPLQISSDLPEDTAQLFHAALERTPGKRPKSPAVFIEALARTYES
jgi:serine/threonine protein kinase